jgi:hypothetical protein
MENASEGRKENPFALEETTARTISEMERPKFLMFDPESFRGSLRNFSGIQEIARLFLPRRDLFCAFLDPSQKCTFSFRRRHGAQSGSIVRRLFS